MLFEERNHEISLNRKEIHLWCTFLDDIPNSKLLHKYQGLLSEEETQRQEQFIYEADRHQYLISRALLRTSLSRYDISSPPQQWRFRKNTFGKPEIDNDGHNRPIYFNLSHCHKLMVVAITREQPIGVDVEWTLQDTSVINIAESYFSEPEIVQLKLLEKSKQQEFFFDLWTLKEAYVKACGKGLSIPFKHFSYQFIPSDEIHVSFYEEIVDSPDNWQFCQLMPSHEHKIALAIKSNGCLVKSFEGLPYCGFEEAHYPVVRRSPVNI
jgi:4'-phosphopantetheinyl transferase